MTFKTKGKFGGRETRTVAVRLPIDIYEVGKIAINEFVDNYIKDYLEAIKIKEILKENPKLELIPKSTF